MANLISWFKLATNGFRIEQNTNEEGLTTYKAYYPYNPDNQEDFLFKLVNDGDGRWRLEYTEIYIDNVDKLNDLMRLIDDERRVL